MCVDCIAAQRIADSCKEDDADQEDACICPYDENNEEYATFPTEIRLEQIDPDDNQ